MTNTNFTEKMTNKFYYLSTKATLIILVLFFASGLLIGQEVKLTASDGAAADLFGYSVSISGTTAIVGAYRDDDNGSLSGSAYIYEQIGGVWTETTKLTASDGAAADLFGISVSISGTTAIVGATENGAGGGSAYIYEQIGGVWTETTKLTASDGAGGDFFGNSVSISGTTAIVGAFGDDGNGGSFSGSAYIYELIGGVWTETTKLTDPNGAISNFLGFSVSISGTTAIVGSHNDDDNGNGSGSAHIYEQIGGVWTEVTKLTASDGAASDVFGYSVSISGTTAIVGAHGEDDNGSSSGSAYIYEQIGGVWTETTKLTASDAAAADFFGASVSISGTTAIVSAQGDDDNGNSSGSAYIYEQIGGVWTEAIKLTASDAAAADFFGLSVSISGTTAIVGAHGNDDNGIDSGSAYIVSTIPNTPPNAVCTNYTAQLGADGTATITGANIDGGSNDAEGAVTLSVSPTIFDCSHLGAPQTVTLTVTDAAGLTDICTAVVTVEDNVLPIALCKTGVVAQLDANGMASITAADINAGSSDNCGIASMSVSPNTFTCAQEGSNVPVTLTVTDNEGNVSSCMTTVEVDDAIPPTAVCSNITVQLDANGMASISPGDIENGSTDNCGTIYMVSVSPNTFDCSNIGANAVILTINDGNGNQSTCTATVTIEDNIDPVINCPNNLIVDNDPGRCSAAVVVPSPTASDNCTGIAELKFKYIELDPNNGTTIGSWSAWSTNTSITLPVGLWRVRWRARDLAGNTNACNFRIKVKDNEKPVIACPSNFSVGTDSGVCQTAINLPLPTVSDNCDTNLDLDFRYRSNDGMGNVGTWTSWMTNTNINLAPGRWQMQWRATDDANKSSKCQFFITVNDTEAPTIDTPCPQDITLCGAQNVTWTAPTAMDNCGITSTVNSHDSGDYFNVGTTTVTYTFYDTAGLSVSCSFDVVIYPLPNIAISDRSLPTFCQGLKKLSVRIMNEADLTAPITYAWSHGLGSDNEVVVSENNTTYSVTITDGNNCSSVATFYMNVDASNLLSAHVLVGDDELEMTETEVWGGGVGMMDGDEVSIEDNSNIHTFLESEEVSIDGSSSVANYMDAPSTLGLPAFSYNTFNDNNNVTVLGGGTTTLSGSHYGKITVFSNGTLIFDNPNIYVKKIRTMSGATLKFVGKTNVMVKKDVKIGARNTVNASNMEVVMYVGDDFKVSQGSTVILDVFAQEGIEVNENNSNMTTYMTGLFISHDGIESGDKVVWDWNVGCGTVGAPMPLLAANLGKVKTTTISKELVMYPNPSNGLFTLGLENYMDKTIDITIYNTIGEVIWQSHTDRVEDLTVTIDLSSNQFANGIYLISVASEGKVETKSLVLNR